MNRASLAKLKSFAPSLEETAYETVSRSPADASRLRALAEILKSPAKP